MSTSRLIIASSLAATTAATVLLGLATPAMAADGPGPYGSGASFGVLGGNLTISVPTTGASLNGTVSSATAAIATGSLGTVSVSDLRGGTESWSVSVSSSTFKSGTLLPIPATNVGYSAGAVTPGGPGAGTYKTPTLTDISIPVAGVSSSATSGNNTAVWNPTISVTVPANTALGTYSGIITHSAA